MIDRTRAADPNVHVNLTVSQQDALRIIRAVSMLGDPTETILKPNPLEVPHFRRLTEEITQAYVHA